MKYSYISFDDIVVGDRIHVSFGDRGQAREGQSPRNGAEFTVVALGNDLLIGDNLEFTTTVSGSRHGGLTDIDTRGPVTVIRRRFGDYASEARVFRKVTNPRGAFFAAYAEYCQRYNLPVKDRAVRHAITRLVLPHAHSVSAKHLTDGQFDAAAAEFQRLAKRSRI